MHFLFVLIQLRICMAWIAEHTYGILMFRLPTHRADLMGV